MSKIRQARKFRTKRGIQQAVRWFAEALESRVLLSANTWNGATADWNTPGDWSLSRVPNSSDSVVINAGTVTVSTADVAGTLTTAAGSTLNLTGSSLTLNGSSSTAGALNVSGGTLTNSSQVVTFSGSLTLSGSGTIQGGALTASGGAQMTATGGTLNGVTLNANLNLTAQNASVTVLNGLTLNGTAAIGGSGTGYNFMDFSGSQALGGTGAVVFGNVDYSGLIVTQNSTTLTIGSGITVRGGSSSSVAAALGYTTYYGGGGSNTTIINQGTIDADTSGTGVTIYVVGGSGETFTNQGTIEAANGGSLSVNGMSGNIDTATLSGSSSLSVNGTNLVNNLGLAVPAGATLTLAGATGNLGSVQIGGAGSAVTVNGTSLSNNLGLTIPAGATLTLAGVTGNLGSVQIGGAGSAVTINGTGLSNNLGLTIPAGATLTLGGVTGNLGSVQIGGTGGVVAIGGTSWSTNLGLAVPTGATLTLSGTWTNPASQSITATGATLSLGDQSSSSTNAWVNAGTITATNSMVNLGGEFSVADLGTLNRTGGALNLTGTLDLLPGALTLTATTGSWNIAGGKIEGGTVTATGGASLAVSSAGGTLNGVTLNANLDLTAQNASVTVLNGLTLNGTATIGGSGSGYNFMEFSGNQALGGTGAVVFGNVDYSGLIVTQNSTTLTIGSGITVRGGSSSSVAAALGYTTYYGGGGSNTTIINQGTIDADTSGTGVTIYVVGGSGETFTNQGTIEAANGGSLSVNGMSGNIDTATLSGSSSLSVNGTNLVNNLGLAVPAGATLTLAGATGNLGSVQIGGAGSAVAVNGTSLSNNLGLTIPAGATLTLAGVTGNLGSVQIGGAGSAVTINGTGLSNNLGLTIPAGATLTLSGTWTNPASQSITATGATLSLGDQSSSSTNDWVNAGAITATNSTVNLGGEFTLADLGTLNRTGGTVNLTGTLDLLPVAPSALSATSASGQTSVTLNWTDNSTVATGYTVWRSTDGMNFTQIGTASGVNASTYPDAGLTLGKTYYYEVAAYDVVGQSPYSNIVSVTVGAGAGSNVGPGTPTAPGGSGGTLTLTPTTGNWNIAGGKIVGGTVTATGGAQMTESSGGTLNGVTLNANLNLAYGSGVLTVLNGLTLNGTATFAGYDNIGFSGSQTLAGTGTVVLGGIGAGLAPAQSNTTLTIGPGIIVHGGGSSGTGYIGYNNFTGGGGSNMTIINQGTINADSSGTGITINPTGAFINQGTIEAANGGTLYVNSLAPLNGSSALGGNGTGTLALPVNLTGNTTNAAGYSPLETVKLSGSGTAASPQLLEAMSDDEGGVAAGYINNFVYGALVVGSSNYVELVDQSNNSGSGSAEAVYCVSLTVPSGSTLNLNGLHVYAGATSIAGSVVGGVISLAALPPAVAAVSGLGVAIANNSTTTSPANGTNFGSASQNTTSDETYSIANSGIATLSVGTVSLPTGFTVVSAPPSTITAHATGTFTISMTTTTAGTFGGSLSFSTSDSANNPYSFVVTGTVTPAEPSAGVTYNSVPVVDGYRSTSTGNGTDLGSTAQGGAPVAHTFIISNSGNAILNLGTISLPAGFSLLGTPSASVAAGGNTSFTLGLGTANFGVFSGIVSFATNDPYNNPYTFEVTGTVTAAPSPITAVTYNGVTVADHSIGTSTASGTNFGFSLQGGSPVVHTFTISNSGNAILNLGTINVPSGYSIVGTPATSVAPGGSANFTFGLSTTNVGTFGGNVSFSTNDANNNPYAFAVTGMVGLSTAAYLAVTPPNLQSTTAAQSTSFALGSFTATNATAPFTVTVNWGDGSAASVFNVSNAGTIPAQNHTYTTYGSVTASIIVQDSLGNASNTATFPVSIAPAPATIAITPPANQTATPAQSNWILLGSFTQSAGIAPYNVAVNWGDGSAESYFSVSSAGALPATPHTYFSTGSNTATVTVTDAVGHTSNSAAFTVTVASAIINLTPAANQNATVGQSSALALGSFTQSNATAPFTVTVNWGDGGAQSIFSVASAGTIPATLHTYAVSGNDTVTVTVMDSNGHTSNSVAFIVTAGPAAMVAFTQPPPATTPVGTATGPVTVAIEDPYGSTVATDGSIVTLTLGSGTFANGQSSISVAASGGMATFSSLVINAAGNYVLTASDGSLATAAAKVAILPPAPALSASQVGDGSVQRSSVKSLAVTFSEAVNFSSGSFTLYKYAQNANGSINTNVAPTDVSSGVTATSTDGITWTLSVISGGSLDRTAASTAAGFLANGIYQLVLHGAQVTDAATGAVNYNSGADQIAGFSSVESGGTSNYFHVLYGDLNGDGKVNATDYFQFSRDYLANIGASNYNAAFDYNGDGKINATDYFQFSRNYLLSYSY